MKGRRGGIPGVASRSFTLVEMLVAVAVAVLLFACLSQIVSLASRAFNDDRKRMDAWDQARTVFDRIGFDWNGRVRNMQVPSFAVKPNGGTGNDAFVLISATPAMSGSRLFSVIQYEIDASDPSDARTLALQRGSLGFSFNGDSTPQNNPTDLLHPAGFFASSQNPSPLAFPNPSLFQPLGDGVFAAAVAFLTSGYTNAANAWVPPGIQALPSTPPANPYWPPNGWPSTAQTPAANVVDLTSTNIVAMVVGIAVLDPASRKIMTAAQFAALAAAFAFPATSTNTPVSYWEQNVLTPDFYLQAPPKAYQAVKVYQRFYYAQ